MGRTKISSAEIMEVPPKKHPNEKRKFCFPRWLRMTSNVYSASDIKFFFSAIFSVTEDLVIVNATDSYSNYQLSLSVIDPEIPALRKANLLRNEK